ncbi:MAG TPA: hypothetical protein DCQ31_06730 [Bacteroidales bacterium]|nr:hypothetical protein [Bacteroidales bacterium]
MKQILIYISILTIMINGIYAQQQNFKSNNTTIAQVPAEIQLSVYPNPVTDNNFVIKTDVPFHKVEVLNIIGNMVFKAENLSSDTTETKVMLENAEKGFYIVRISFEGNKVLVKKLLVK